MQRRWEIIHRKNGIWNRREEQNMWQNAGTDQARNAGAEITRLGLKEGTHGIMEIAKQELRERQRLTEQGGLNETTGICLLG